MRSIFYSDLKNNCIRFKSAIPSTETSLSNYVTVGQYYWSPGGTSITDLPVAYGNTQGFNLTVTYFDGYATGYVLQHIIDATQMNYYRIVKKDTHVIYRTSAIQNDLDTNGWYTLPTSNDYKAIKANTDILNNYNHTVVKNLLNPNTIIQGGRYNERGQWVTDQSLYSSDFIPVMAGDTISLRYSQSVVLWDEGKHFISQISSLTNPGRGYYIKIPDTLTNVRYITVYGLANNSTIDAVYRFPSYIGPAYSFPYNKDFIINTSAINKLIIAFGDSRTWYDGNKYATSTLTPNELCVGYLTYIRRGLTCAVQNEGVSGWTTPQINTKIHNTSIANGDIILLAGGINDFLQSVPIGTLSNIGDSFNTNTVYGALQDAIEHIITTKPEAKLMLINPFTGWIHGGSDEFPDSYADIKRNVAKFYKLPLLDLTDICGFNILNRDDLFADDITQVSYYLHLNNIGNAVIGQMVSSFVSNGF